MREWESQSHVRWYCRYHIVIVPKYRRKAIFGALCRELGLILKELCKRYEVELIEGHVMVDHVHMLLSIPPKFSNQGVKSVCVEPRGQICLYPYIE